jgi:hypothetical protein
MGWGRDVRNIVFSRNKRSLHLPEGLNPSTKFGGCGQANEMKRQMQLGCGHIKGLVPVRICSEMSVDA